MSESLTLSPEVCRERLTRVRDMLSRRSLDRAVFVSHENIQYLTGFRPARLMQAAVYLETTGRCILSAPNKAPEHAAVDEIVTFDAQWCSTLRHEQAEAALSALLQAVGSSQAKQTGVEFSVIGPHIGRQPRSRPAGDGELFILDLGPAYRGYYADNCRTIAVIGTRFAVAGEFRVERRQI
ncbi:MAG: aminopeptidase P family N-terminal domain-containing protein [Planctomycetota bacterium]|nr:aminopeptidase P family N-terminal domain-containing protein [Planctomycetota bacterium]